MTVKVVRYGNKRMQANARGGFHPRQCTSTLPLCCGVQYVRPKVNEDITVTVDVNCGLASDPGQCSTSTIIPHELRHSSDALGPF